MRRNGAFTLGDVGYLDDDGYLFLCDRRSDVIISGGVNIYPAQIENALLDLPAVVDCCVVGVPDDEWGERVHAVVQRAPAEDIDADVILAHCAAPPRPVPGAAQPRVRRGAAPTQRPGKLARRAVRDRYWAGRARRI